MISLDTYRDDLLLVRLALVLSADRSLERAYWFQIQLGQVGIILAASALILSLILLSRYHP